MTRIALLPFFSQQNKQTGGFLLSSCVATKHCMYIGRRIMQELKWDVRLIIPDSKIDSWPVVSKEIRNSMETRSAPIPNENFAQRLSWYPEQWSRLFGDCDILYTSHELIGWAIKRQMPKLKVLQMHYLSPSTAWPWMRPLFELNYMAADRLTCLSQPMRLAIQRDLIDSYAMRHQHIAHGDILNHVSCWPLSVNTDALQSGGFPPERDIDLLFVLRGSSTNYSHHQEFFAALDILRRRGWRKLVGFTDYTRYLSNEKCFEFSGVEPYIVLGDPQDQEQYKQFLYRSKAVIGLCDNGYGGESVREAVYCGAYPILLDCPGYWRLVGSQWPGLVMGVNPLTIADAIERAFDHGLWGQVTPAQIDAVHQNLHYETYNEVWQDAIKPDLMGLIDA